MIGTGGWLLSPRSVDYLSTKRNEDVKRHQERTSVSSESATAHEGERTTTSRSKHRCNTNHQRCRMHTGRRSSIRPAMFSFGVVDPLQIYFIYIIESICNMVSRSGRAPQRDPGSGGWVKYVMIYCGTRHLEPGTRRNPTCIKHSASLAGNTVSHPRLCMRSE